MYSDEKSNYHPPVNLLKVNDLRQIGFVHDFDSLVVFAARYGANAVEQVVTWGNDPSLASAASDIGDRLKYEILAWDPERELTYEDDAKNKAEAYVDGDAVIVLLPTGRWVKVEDMDSMVTFGSLREAQEGGV